MKKYFVLGESHGRWDIVKSWTEICLMNEYDGIIICGEEGFSSHWTPQVVPFKSEVPIHFIDGNHSSYSFLLKHKDLFAESNWFFKPRGTIENGILYLSGAVSIDKSMRIPEFDWWENEDITPSESDELKSHILKHKESIHTVIAHDMPRFLYQLYPVKTYPIVSNTSLLFNDLYLNHDFNPENHYTGHMHFDFSKMVRNTMFEVINTSDTSSYRTLQLEDVVI